MYTKQEIILQYYVKGESQRSISDHLGVSRSTVRRYVACYEQHLLKTGDPQEALRVCLSTAESYDSSTRNKKKLTKSITDKIDELLQSNVRKRQEGLHKQLLKKIDILDLLRGQGIDIGYTTVCNYIKSKEKNHSKEVFIRQSYSPGSSCEFDWAEVKLEICGKMQKYQLAVFTSSYSNYRYAVLFSKQDTLCFQEAHILFILHCGGAFVEMVYDNMRVAVARFVGKHEKQPTQALLNLRAHYQFTHRFCNIYKGNEKGHVERSVEYIRRKAFGQKYCFESIEAASEYLSKTIERINNTSQQLTGKTACELFEEEKECLRPSLSPMECSEMEVLRVDTYATISYKTNRYSVPERLVGQFVEIKASSDKIVAYHENKQVAGHARSYGKHQWNINIAHYLDTFQQKPGALANSTALISNNYLKGIYDQHFKHDPRAFIDLLQYCYGKKIDQNRLAATLDKIQANHLGKQLNVEAVMALLGNQDSYCQPRQISEEDSIGELSKDHLKKVTNLLLN